MKFAELLKAHDLTPEDVLRPQPEQPVIRPAPPPPAQPRDWCAVVEDILLTRHGALYPREHEFLPALLGRGFAPSVLQTNWLIRIIRRTRVAPWTAKPWDTEPGDTFTLGYAALGTGIMTSPLDRPIHITLFPDLQANQRESVFSSLREFAERLRNTRAPTKAMLRLFVPVATTTSAPARSRCATTPTCASATASSATTTASSIVR